MPNAIDTLRRALTSAKDCDIEHLAPEALAALADVEALLQAAQAVEWLSDWGNGEDELLALAAAVRRVTGVGA